MERQVLDVRKKLCLVVILILTIGLGMTLATTSSVWAQLPTKLGYVDMEKAVNESKAGKEARDKFLKYMKKKRAESEKKKKELTSMKQILEKQGALLAEDVRVEKEREYQKKVREYQLYLKNLRDDARTKEMEMSKKIIREIQKVIFSYAKKDTIIKIYDQEYSKKKK